MHAAQKRKYYFKKKLAYNLSMCNGQSSIENSSCQEVVEHMIVSLCQYNKAPFI